MQEIKNELKKVIQDLYGLDFEPEVVPAPGNIKADYSSNAPLKLSKELHKSPMEIAEVLSTTLKDGAFEEHIWRQAKYKAAEPHEEKGEGASRKTTALSISQPGFLNFTLSDEYLSTQLVELVNNFDRNILLDEYKNKTIICEFSDPNPFKVLHVGHLYTSIVGDSISRLYEHAGAKVIRANFGGDVGLHVAKTMYALLQNPPHTLTIDDIAKCYVGGTAAYEDDEKAHQEITKLNKEIYHINAEGDHKRVTQSKNIGEGKPDKTNSENKLATLYWQGRKLSYDYFKDFYASIGLKFDKYYPESAVVDLGLAKVKEQLENGVYEESHGAVIFNGEKYGLHTRVFINQAGVPTYETKDVGLIFTKWNDYHFDKSIVITGNEQQEYMKVVLKSVEQYAPQLVDRTTHLTHGLVKLPGNIKMSSRKGNFLKAKDVLEMVREALKNEYGSDDETVSLAATKYAFLKYKMGGNIIFNPQESVKMTGNSGPYLLYACVRAKKILTSVGNIPEKHLSQQEEYGVIEHHDDGGEGAFRRSINKDIEKSLTSSILNSYERQLIKKILEYKLVLQEAVIEMAPHKVANYLYLLAQEFSRFYEHCPVAGSEEETERAQITKVYLNTMTHGLSILGINIPEEM